MRIATLSMLIAAIGLSNLALADTATGNAASLSKFSRLMVSGPISLSLHAGSGPATGLSSADPRLNQLQIRQEADTLQISLPANWQGAPLALELNADSVQQLRTAGAAKVVADGLHGEVLHVAAEGTGSVSLQGKLAKLSLLQRGSGALSARGVQADKLEVVLDGAGDINLGRLKAQTLIATLRGAGELRATGRAERVELTALAPVDVELPWLTASQLIVANPGGGTIQARATERLEAKASDMGDMLIYGSPSQLKLEGERVRLGAG